VRDALVAAGFGAPAAGMEALRLLGVGRPEAHLADVPGLAESLDGARGALRAAGLAPDRLEAELRYGWIGGVLGQCVTRRAQTGRSASDRIDAVVLHRLWGPVIFVLLMALVFQGIFTWATPLMDAIEGVIGALGGAVAAVMPDGDLESLLVDGIIAGVGSVLVFLPQIALLFLFIGVLEDSGYMARAAFLMDGLMRRVGLHGKSFIPMLSGYACAVPGIMAARTVENDKDRLATIMVVPLMSCSARLPIYALLIGAFVPPVAVLGGALTLQGVTMLGMYFLGTITALLVAAVFKRTLLRGPVRPMILELPAYRWPSARNLFISVTGRAQLFVQRAGTVILALSVVLWALATFPKSNPDTSLPEAVRQEQQLERSFLGRIGHAMEPVVRPLGYDWKIGVSIAASFAAREVFVATMGTIYGVGDAEGEGSAALTETLRTERDARTGQLAYTPLVAVGLMVFYVYALMCMSTIAVTVREAGGGGTGWRWGRRPVRLHAGARVRRGVRGVSGRAAARARVGAAPCGLPRGAIDERAGADGGGAARSAGGTGVRGAARVGDAPAATRRDGVRERRLWVRRCDVGQGAGRLGCVSFRVPAGTATGGLPPRVEGKRRGTLRVRAPQRTTYGRVGPARPRG
jgi:ferrous iron transport protein B